MRTLLTLLAVTALVAFASTAPPAAADPTVPTFYVQVTADTQGYGLAPQFEYVPLYGGLPPGSSLIGHATCSQVYVSGLSGPTESSYGPNYDGLPPGTYHFVSSTCASDPGFPLQLDGVSGNYNLVLSGGYYTVTKASTAVGGAGTQGPLQNGTPTPTVLTAVVLDTTTENVQLAGKQVSFGVQLSNGVWDLNVCSSLTTDDGQGDLIATCRLNDLDAQGLYQGTGVWVAKFNGDDLYAPSSFTGQVSGLTTAAQAAKNLSDLANQNVVKLEPHYVPADCGNPLADVQDGSLIEVSLGELTCDQLQALQITTGVLLGIAFAAGAGGQAVIDIATQIAFNAAVRAANAYLALFENLVTVANPIYGL